jgi:hypothetical protein
MLMKCNEEEDFENPTTTQGPKGRTHVKNVGGLPKAISIAVVATLVLSAVFMALPNISRNASAGTVVHDIGNVELEQSDYGRILGEYIQWNGVRQTADIYADIPQPIGILIDEESWLGVYNYQDVYGAMNVADSFGAGDLPDDYSQSGTDVPIYFQENTATMQKSYATYTNRGASTNDPNDVKITQKTWTPVVADWAIIEFTVTNIKSVDITGLRVGYHGYMTGYLNPGIAYDFGGPGGDGGDDRDQWDVVQSTYTIEDNNGAGTTMAFSSADSSRPLDIYYGAYADYLTMAQGPGMVPDDMILYNALMANQLGRSDCPSPPANPACSLRSVVGWNVGTLSVGSSVRLPLVIAFGSDPTNAKSQVTNARAFYDSIYFRYFMTEIQDEGTPMVEVYNWGKPPANTGPGGLTISPDMCASQWSGGSWSAGSIGTNTDEYYTLGGTDAFPSTEGWTLTLCNAGTPIDNVSYGQFDLGPDPVSGESVARIFSTEYIDDWTRDDTPTFGAMNDVPQANWNPPVVLNEIYFNPSNPADKFVELFYLGSTSIDIAGWDIVADNVFDIPAGPDTILSPTNRYYHLREFERPGFFLNLTVSGDNVYLYDDSATPILQDRAGWTTSHTVDTSMTRWPDGNGTANGFDDVTSYLAGWKFDQNPTYSIVLVGDNSMQWGDPGYFAWFSLNVTNLQAASDYIDMTAQSENGWTVEFFEFDKSTPLADNEMPPDGLPDTGSIAPNVPYRIWARVWVPFPPTLGRDNATVYAQASLDTLGRDRALLKTFVNPWIDPKAAIEPPAPDTIYEKTAGALGFLNQTTVTVNATGSGFTQYTGQDMMFLLDSSGSMGSTDPDMDAPIGDVCDYPDGSGLDPADNPVNLPQRVQAAWNYIDMMSGEDRGGFVDFDGIASDTLKPTDPRGAIMRVPLDLGTMADNYQFLRQAPYNPLTGQGGVWTSNQCGGTVAGTPISVGMNISNEELRINGDPRHVKVSILLTDGQSPDYPQAFNEAARAVANEITYYVIGLTITPGSPEEDSLIQIANMTGGTYYPAPDASALIDIFTNIMDKVRNIAGFNPDPGSPGLMINFVLEQGLDLIDGTFQLVPGTIEVDPYPDMIDYNPTNTTLVWDWSSNQIRVHEYWAVRFNISSTVVGPNVPVNILPDSSITYRTPNGINLTNRFSLLTITVLTPTLQPIITDLDIEPGDVVNITFFSIVGAEEYEIFGGQTQTSIDLTAPIATVPAPQTWYLNSTSLGLYDEYYYVVRAVDTDTFPPTRTATSNTAGYYRMQFAEGTNTFSLPLEPFGTLTLASLLVDMSAVSISILDANNDWQTYTTNPPGDAQLGAGYVVDHLGGSHVFTGEPASMILYTGASGFDASNRNSLMATIDISGDVTLTWTTIPGMEYYIYHSSTRNGLFTPLRTILNGGVPVAAPPFVHPGAASGVGNNYYMIVPRDPIGGTNGSSTYSIGVETVEYNRSDMFGLPLKPSWGPKSADWYVDQIAFTLGIVFYENDLWKAHFKEFPEGVYDTVIEFGRGYKLSIYATSTYTYTGW